MKINKKASLLIILSFALSLLAIEIRTKKATNNVLAASTEINKTDTPSISHEIESKSIDREENLREFFASYNSPLVDNIDTFISVADQYKIDYRLLPSIACMESTCGRFLIPGTYNPFGWGKGRIYFSSYDESITKVADGLNKIYLSRGLNTPEKIAPVYNPPSPHSWTKGVVFFMNKIASYTKEQS